ncbi:MAG: hypothetical protein U0Z26_11715 [Anaerolineales bacterium]
MNKKFIFSVISVLCAIALAACSTGTPTTGVNDTNSTSSSTASTSASNPSTESSLACSNTTTATLTPEVTEGPYFTANSPERASLLEDGMAGTKLIITGYVYDTNCQPIANAMLDFWQADANGVYDNSGYTLRGHQFTDENGRYELTTVVPGIYTGRTEHIHVKVQAPNGKLITSQLFFPGVAENDADGIFIQSLLLSTQESSDGMQAQFNFVVPTS